MAERQLKRRKRVLSKYDGLKLGWLQFAKWFVGVVVVVFFIFRFVIGFSYVSGDSMYDTFHDGQPVVYIRIVPKYHRQDVVSVRVPSGDYYIKRVIAVGGDTVDLIDGIVYVNGEALNETYVDDQLTEKWEGSHVRYPYTVEADDVFVMGDNRAVSMDSRSFGAVNTLQIKGKIIFHLW